MHIFRNTVKSAEGWRKFKFMRDHSSGNIEPSQYWYTGGSTEKAWVRGLSLSPNLKRIFIVLTTADQLNRPEIRKVTHYG